MLKAHSFFSPKLDLTKQNGVYAIAPIRKGELVSVWNGNFMSRSQLANLPEKDRYYSVQIEDDIFLTPNVRGSLEPSDYILHSCDPNTGISGQLALLALRDIAIGERISVDYATINSSPYLELDCQCGAANCRGRITAEDWQKPELQEKYKGFFIPYLQRRIDAQRK
jgi:SET domain-containing protein